MVAKASPAVAAVPVAAPVLLSGGGGGGGIGGFGGSGGGGFGGSGYSARLSGSGGGRIVSGPSLGTSAGEYGSLALNNGY